MKGCLPLLIAICFRLFLCKHLAVTRDARDYVELNVQLFVCFVPRIAGTLAPYL